MEKQFNILLNDYRDNYIQYKSNGNEHYKSSYESAQTAIENLFKEANNLPAKTLDTSDLEMKLIHENDNRVGAEMRVPTVSFVQQYSYRTQYIIIGSLGTAIALQMLKPWTLFGVSL
jgi:hypothetical protein